MAPDPATAARPAEPAAYHRPGTAPTSALFWLDREPGNTASTASADPESLRGRGRCADRERGNAPGAARRARPPGRPVGPGAAPAGRTADRAQPAPRE
ncbi:hypothetical protein DEF23_21510 [Marinitenerispora sediminis]|uniref:Uncharacterized protein n=1 Tax=Marinitenerispora sediminis TaxID=1931232 RepID=A0A368SYD3_9ACTN|nr:hypothetical protein DEF28_22815 [Marinitenerispora sediminis]RCV49141.1 hypothetical protein DEF24_25510 [Marinitenerispora sediminis]RCV50817.1 hypothetical protein DEF23_21510 [Marinitenerispora sediminis]